MTNITDPAEPEATQTDLEENGTVTPAAEATRIDPEATVAVMSTPNRTLTLTDYLNEQVPAKLRAATYSTIVTAVASGELKGIIHETQKGQMTVTLSNGKEVTRPYAHVLLKKTADLQEKLDVLCVAAINKEMIRTAGQSMTVEEIIAMGDELDFDAIVEASRKVHEKKRKAAQRRTQARRKERPGPTTTTKARA